VRSQVSSTEALRANLDFVWSRTLDTNGGFLVDMSPARTHPAPSQRTKPLIRLSGDDGTRTHDSLGLRGASIRRTGDPNDEARLVPRRESRAATTSADDDT
jgi:hypothetical protein